MPGDSESSRPSWGRGRKFWRRRPKLTPFLTFSTDLDNFLSELQNILAAKSKVFFLSGGHVWLFYLSMFIVKDPSRMDDARKEASEQDAETLELS